MKMNGFIKVGNEYVNVAHIDKVTPPVGGDPAFVHLTGWESPLPWREARSDDAVRDAMEAATAAYIPAAPGWVLRYFDEKTGETWPHSDRAVVAFRFPVECGVGLVLADGDTHVLDTEGQAALISPTGLVTTGYDHVYPSWAAFVANRFAVEGAGR